MLAALLLACDINAFTCDFTFHGVLKDGCSATFVGNPDENHVMVVELRPLWNKALGSRLEIIRPPGESIDTPAISGVGTLTLRFIPTWQRPWTIVAGPGGDPTAGGEYDLDVSCAKAVNVGPYERSCVYQELSCHQAVEWSLSADSCSGSAYADYFRVYGIKRDVLTIAMESHEFTPSFTIENDAGGVLATSSIMTSDLATMSFTVPRSAFYWIKASSLANGVTGKFKLAMSCADSGCTPPAIVNHSPYRVSVPGGHRAELSVETTSDPKTFYAWYLLDGGLPLPVPRNETPTLITEPVTAKIMYYAFAYNECGSVMSDFFVVEPIAGSRRAAAHH